MKTMTRGLALTFLRQKEKGSVVFVFFNMACCKQANFAIAIPYPGTEFHEMAKKGDGGVKLMTEDFSEYRRYGTAVTEVSGLTQKDLIELQNDGFVSIYSAPWRWKPMLRKHGIIGGLLMLLRVLRLTIRRAVGLAKPFRTYPGIP